MLFEGEKPLFTGDTPRLVGEEDCCCGAGVCDALQEGLELSLGGVAFRAGSPDGYDLTVSVNDEAIAPVQGNEVAREYRWWFDRGHWAGAPCEMPCRASQVIQSSDAAPDAVTAAPTWTEEGLGLICGAIGSVAVTVTITYDDGTPACVASAAAGFYLVPCIGIQFDETAGILEKTGGGQAAYDHAPAAVAEAQAAIPDVQITVALNVDPSDPINNCPQIVADFPGTYVLQFEGGTGLQACSDTVSELIVEENCLGLVSSGRVAALWAVGASLSLRATALTTGMQNSNAAAEIDIPAIAACAFSETATSPDGLITVTASNA